MNGRPIWNSKTGFILAALGSAIGLGNIWRFPYIAYRNGGGAFLIPYFVALFVVGIPLLILEFGLGHYTRRAFPKSLEQISPRFSWLGWWSVSFVMFAIVVYYAVVIAWCGNYLIFSLTQPWGDAQNVDAFFQQDFLGYMVDGKPVPLYLEEATDDMSAGFHFGRLHFGIVVSLLVVWVVNWVITARQLQSGIELASKIFIPSLVLLTAVMVAWSWGFPGAADGRQLYLKPDWSRVFQPQTWIDAFGQIFFTLGIGFGIMVAYASYLPRRADIPTSAFLTAVGNCAFSVFAGFAVFAAIGMLANSRGVDLARIDEVASKIEAFESRISSGGIALTEAEQTQLVKLKAEQQRNDDFEGQMKTFGLLFQTYPAIITEMGPVAGRIFGVLFFLALFVAGVSSSISIIEAFGASCTDQFGWRRSTVATVLCVIGFLMGLVFCTSVGLFLLDLVDHFITTYALVLVAICEAIIVGWLLPAKRLREHLDQYRQPRYGKTFSIVMRLLISLVLFMTWWGLAKTGDNNVGVAIGRFLVVGSAIVLWIDEHWLDFDIRVVIPVLLIFLLDQALIADTTSLYGGYPIQAIIGIGVSWTVGTLVIGIALSLLPGKESAEETDAE